MDNDCWNRTRRVGVTIRACKVFVLFGVGWGGYSIIALHSSPFWLKMCSAISFQQVQVRWIYMGWSHLVSSRADVLEALASPIGLGRFLESMPSHTAGLPDAMVVFAWKVLLLCSVMLLALLTLAATVCARTSSSLMACSILLERS